MAIVARWRLHPLHLFLVRKYLEIEDLTLPLEGPAYGRTMRQVGELAQRELPTMRQLGIVVNDEIDPGLEDALRTLAKPYLWVDSVWFPSLGADTMWRSVAVARGNEIVLGVQAPGETDRFGGVLTVELHENVTLAQTLLPTLPPTPPGNRQPAQVPESSLRTESVAAEHSLMQAAGGNASSIGDRQVAAYRAIACAEHVRGGELAANLRTQGNVSRSRTVKWFDNAEPDGRYLDHARRSSTGELIYLLDPADPQLLGNTIEELAQSVRPKRPA